MYRELGRSASGRSYGGRFGAQTVLGSNIQGLVSRSGDSRELFALKLGWLNVAVQEH